jgi:hypothetical protein
LIQILTDLSLCIAWVTSDCYRHELTSIHAVLILKKNFPQKGVGCRVLIGVYESRAAHFHKRLEELSRWVDGVGLVFYYGDSIAGRCVGGVFL